MAVFPLFGHYFDHLVCLPHTSLPTFAPIASLTGFSALQSILGLLPTFIFPHMSPPTSMPAAYLTGFPAIYLSNKFSYSQSQGPNTGQALILDVFNIGIPILGTTIWALPNSKLASAIFYQFFIFQQMKALRQL